MSNRTRTKDDTDADVAAASEAIDQLTTEGLEWRRRAEAAEAQSVKLRDERDLARRLLKETIDELLPETECAPGCGSYGHAEDCRVYSVLAEFRAVRKERDAAQARWLNAVAVIDDQDRKLDEALVEVERLRAALLMYIPEPRRCRRNEHTGQCMIHADERECQSTKALEVSRSGGMSSAGTGVVNKPAPDHDEAGPATTTHEEKKP